MKTGRGYCFQKRRSMSPSATPATQTAAASTAPTGNQARHQSQPSTLQVPRLPRKVQVHVAKCQACHAKWRSMSPSATPATQSEGGQVVCGQVVKVDKLCVDKLREEVVCGHVWTSCVRTSCVWTSCVCVSKLCVDKCVDKLCVGKL